MLKFAGSLLLAVIVGLSSVTASGATSATGKPADERSANLKRDAWLEGLARELRQKAHRDDPLFAAAIAEGGGADSSCAESWPVLWELAKTGNRNALSEIAALVAVGGMVPPGYPTEPPQIEDVNRLRLLLTIHAMPTVRYHYPRFFTSALAILYREREDAPALWAFDRCLRRAYFDEDAEACLSFAVQRRIIPPFETFVAEIDERAAASPDTLARCLTFESMAREAEHRLEWQEEGTRLRSHDD